MRWRSLCYCQPLPVEVAAGSLPSHPWVPCVLAEVYETSTETLFLGKQDAMQRQTLVPLHHHMRGKPPGGVGMKCLEVACGTGRFATFIKVGCSDEERLHIDVIEAT